MWALLLLAQVTTATYTVDYYTPGGTTPIFTAVELATCGVMDPFPLPTPAQRINPTRHVFVKESDDSTAPPITCVIDSSVSLAQLDPGIVGKRYEGTVMGADGIASGRDAFCVGVPASIAATATDCDDAIRRGQFLIFWCYVLRLCGI